MAKALRFKEEDIQVGKVYTDGKTAGIKVTRIFQKFGCKMVGIQTIVGKQFRSKEWTMGSFLSWAKEEVEMPSDQEEVPVDEQAAADESVQTSE